MKPSGDMPQVRYSSLLLISFNFLMLLVLLCIFLLPALWPQMRSGLEPIANLCAVPSLLAAALSGWFLDRGKGSGSSGAISIGKVQTGALIVYAIAELGALLGILMSQNKWGVIIGVAVFPVGWLAGFLRASALWKAA